MSKKKETDSERKKDDSQIPSAERNTKTEQTENPNDGRENPGNLNGDHKPSWLYSIQKWIHAFFRVARDWIMIVLTGVLAWCTWQLADYTRDMAITNKVIAVANVKVAVAAESSAVATQRTIEITERLAKIQMQPQIGLTGLRCGEFAVAKEFRVDFVIENSGPVVAHDWFHHAELMIGITADVDKFMRNVWRGHAISYAPLPVHVPFDAWTSIAANEMTQGRVDAVKRGGVIIGLRICIVYTDSWGEGHQENFRSTYAPNLNPPTFVTYMPPESRKPLSEH